MSTIPGTDLTAPADYYNRHDSTTAGGTHGEVFDEHLFVAGRVGQSAEINEIQSRTRARIAALGYHLLNDGDIKAGGELTINSGPDIPGGNAGILSPPSVGMVRVRGERSEIWLDGAERIVPERTFQVPNSGLVIVGVYLRQEIVSHLAEPALRDPAIGLRMQGEAGADRLKVTAFWGYDGDGQADGATRFFPVHRLLNGVLQERSLSPEASTISNAIARYDRQSTGGSYIVKGFRVTAIPPVVPEGQDPQATALEALQRYSLEMGEARIFGAEIITDGGQYIEWQARPDTESVLSEPHDSVAEVSQLVGINRAPASELSTVLVQVKITNETVSRGSGDIDTLSKAVSGFYEVRQGATTFAENTDYQLSSGKIEWISANRPSVGTQYQVDYRYKKNLTNDAELSPTGLFATLPATLGAGESYVALANGIELTYRTQLPRIDRICLDRFGQYHIIRGIPGRYGEQPVQPRIPTELLPLCSIYQTWIPSSRRVSNDGPRMVSMARLESHDRDISNLYNLVATSLLHASAEAYTAKDALGRRGLFLDAFRDDAARDPGVEQTAQITRGTLTLGVEVTVYSGTLGEPITLRRGDDVVQVEQILSSESMQINPYLVFTPPVSRAVLTPKFDFWTTSITKILPPKYVDVYRYVDWFTKGPVPFDPNGFFLPTPDGWSPPPFNWDDWELMHKDTKFLGEESGGIEEFTSSQEAPFMREITIRFRLDNWPNGERLKTVTIDGVPVAFEAL